MSRSGITLGWQADELALITGAVNGMAKEVKTNAFLGDLVKYSHTKMSNSFDHFIDLAYRSEGGRRKLHHVYEWRLAPESPQAKLWKHMLVGHGASKTATWDWRASKMPILTPKERAANDDDPMSKLPSESVEKFSKRSYFFYWKAPVMEGNLPVYIRPINAKRLAFPSAEKPGELRFSYGLSVSNPGGDETFGAFTALWASWWNTEAPRVFDESVGPEVSRDLENSVRLKSRRRTSTVKISAVTDYQRLMLMGEDWAEVNIDRYRRKYRSKS